MFSQFAHLAHSSYYPSKMICTIYIVITNSNHKVIHHQNSFAYLHTHKHTHTHTHMHINIHVYIYALI